MKKNVTRIWKAYGKKYPAYTGNLNINNNEKGKNEVDTPRTTKHKSSKYEQLVLLKKKKALILYKILLDKLTDTFMGILGPVTKVSNLYDFRVYNELTLTLDEASKFENVLYSRCNENSAPFNLAKKSLEIEDCVIKSPFDIIRGHKKSKDIKKKNDSKHYFQSLNNSSSKIQKSSFLYNLLFKKIIDPKVESMMPNINSDKLSHICDFRVNEDSEHNYHDITMPVKFIAKAKTIEKDSVYSDNLNNENILEPHLAPIAMRTSLNPVLGGYNSNVENKTKPSDKTARKIGKLNSAPKIIKSQVKVIPPSQSPKVPPAVKKVNLIKSNVSDNITKVNPTKIISIQNGNKPGIQTEKPELQNSTEPYTDQTLEGGDHNNHTAKTYTVNSFQLDNYKKNLIVQTDNTAVLKENCIISCPEEEAEIKMVKHIQLKTTDLNRVLVPEEVAVELVEIPKEIEMETHYSNEIESEMNGSDEEHREVKIEEKNIGMDIKSEEQNSLLEGSIIEQILNTSIHGVVSDNKNKEKENHHSIGNNKKTELVVANIVDEKRLKKEDDKQTACNDTKINIKSHLVSFKTKNGEPFLHIKEQDSGQERKGDLIDINDVIELEKQKPSNEIKRKVNNKPGIETNNQRLRNKLGNEVIHSERKVNTNKKEKVNNALNTNNLNTKCPMGFESNISLTLTSQRQTEGSMIHKSNDLQRPQKRKHNNSNLRHYETHELPLETGVLAKKLVCNEITEHNLPSSKSSSVIKDTDTELSISAEDVINPTMKQKSTSTSSFDCSKNSLNVSVHSDTRLGSMNPKVIHSCINKENSVEGKGNSDSKKKSYKIINQQLRKRNNVAVNIQKDKHNEYDNKNTKEIEIDQRMHKNVNRKKLNLNLVVNDFKTLLPKIIDDVAVKNVTKEMTSSPEQSIDIISSQNKISKIKIHNLNKNLSMSNSEELNLSTINNLDKKISFNKSQDLTKSKYNENTDNSTKEPPLKTHSVLEDIRKNKINFEVNTQSLQNGTKETHSFSRSRSSNTFKSQSSDTLVSKDNKSQYLKKSNNNENTANSKKESPLKTHSGLDDIRNNNINFEVNTQILQKGTKGTYSFSRNRSSDTVKSESTDQLVTKDNKFKDLKIYNNNEITANAKKETPLMTHSGLEDIKNNNINFDVNTQTLQKGTKGTDSFSRIRSSDTFKSESSDKLVTKDNKFKDLKISNNNEITANSKKETPLIIHSGLEDIRNNNINFEVNTRTLHKGTKETDSFSRCISNDTFKSESSNKLVTKDNKSQDLKKSNNNEFTANSEKESPVKTHSGLDDIGNNKISFEVITRSSQKGTKDTLFVSRSRSSDMFKSDSSDNSLTKDKLKNELREMKMKHKKNKLHKTITVTEQPHPIRQNSAIHDEEITSKIKKDREISPQTKLKLAKKSSNLSSISNDKLSQVIKNFKPSHKPNQKVSLQSLKLNKLISRLEEKLSLEDSKNVCRTINKNSNLNKYETKPNKTQNVLDRDKDVKAAAYDISARLRKGAKIVPCVQAGTQNKNPLSKPKVEKLKVVNDGLNTNKEMNKSNLKSFMRKKENNFNQISIIENLVKHHNHKR